MSCGSAFNGDSGHPNLKNLMSQPMEATRPLRTGCWRRIMPNPKHKHSRARRDKRRTQKLRVTPPGMSVCPQCHELKLPHYTCLNCGAYKGKAVIQVEEV